MPTTLTPTSWNAVAIGGWNPHILNPHGVAKYVFGLAEGTPVELALAIDATGSFKVNHAGFAAVPGAERLIIETSANTFAAISEAAGYLRQTMERLPVTPIAAAGINLRYNLEDPEETLLPKIKVALDDAISDEGFEIKSRRLSRTLEYGTGVINLKLETDEAGKYKIELNLDCRTDRDGIMDWLATPPAAIRETTRKVVERILGVAIPEERDV